MEPTPLEISAAPLVSFVVPCYKYAHFLAKCVNSILAQDYGCFEVLIMDNCSPDNTPEVAQSFKDPRVRHIRNDSNLGHVRNYNKGLTLARGKYVWVLCADDVLRSSAVLGRFVDVMERNANLAFVFCRALELREEQEGSLVSWADCGDQDCQWQDSTFFLRLIDSCCMVMSSVMIRKEFLDRVGLFPVDLPYSDDWYIWSVLAMHYGVAYFAEPMVLCRHHEESLTTQYSKEFARICLGDELAVLWRVGCEAERGQNTNLRDACRASLIRRAKRHLMAALWGSGHRISTAEFEEILKSRIPDGNDLQQIRSSVYNELANDVRALYHVDRATIELPDEISVYWDFWRRAEFAGVSSLRQACELVLVHRLSSELRARSSHNDPNLSEHEFSEILRSRIPDAEAASNLRALVYRDLAEQQYSNGEYTSATESYRFALEARPGHPGTLSKYLLLKMGAPGIWIRQVSHHVRKSSRRV